jgi:hypothetical protein
MLGVSRGSLARVGDDVVGGAWPRRGLGKLPLVVDVAVPADRRLVELEGGRIVAAGCGDGRLTCCAG